MKGKELLYLGAFNAVSCGLCLLAWWLENRP